MCTQINFVGNYYGKVMSLHEAKQAIGWYFKDIHPSCKSMTGDHIDLYQNDKNCLSTLTAEAWDQHANTMSTWFKRAFIIKLTSKQCAYESGGNTSTL